MKTIIKIISNIVKFRDPVIHLGRWCHPNYSNKCNTDIKSHLANIDNSSNATGLCKNLIIISTKNS